MNNGTRSSDVGTDVGSKNADMPTLTATTQPKSKFRKAIERAITECSAENGSDTPDFALAGFIEDSVNAFDKAVLARDAWYGDRVGLSEAVTA